MRRRRVYVVVGMLLLMTGCAGPAIMSSSAVGSPSSAAPALGTLPSAGRTAPDAGTASVAAAATSPAVSRLAAIERTRQTRAADDAKRVLDRAILPDSARRTTSTADAPQGPAMGMSDESTVVDAVEYWRVPLSVRQSSDWMNEHPPVASNYSGSSSIQPRRGVDLIGTEWVAAPPGDWGAKLSISVQTINTTSSVWRVDGVAEWVDPHPLKDKSEGSRWRVTIAGGCPAVDGYLVGVRNSGADLATVMLPSGSPTAALICGYGGNPTGKPFRRQVNQLLTPCEGASVV